MPTTWLSQWFGILFLGYSEAAMIPPRDFAILVSVAHYDLLTRAQITRLHFPGDDDGRITRKRLRVLHERGLLNQTGMQVVNPAVNGGVTAPVYYPSAKGCAFLTQELADDSYLTVNTTTPNWTTLYHSVACADMHILLDTAAALKPAVKVVRWYGERALRDPKEQEPQQRYRLFTLISQDPYLVCKPDAGFVLEKDGFRKIFFLEVDRDTTKSAERVAVQKCGGFAGLLDRRLHQTIFPEANVEFFAVLLIAPTDRRRDALRKAICEKPSGKLWRFAALPDLTPETVLTGPVWYSAAGEAKPLVQGGTS